MRHEEISPLLNAYLDRELGAEQHLLVEAHLLACGICADDLEKLMSVSAAVKSATMSQMPVDDAFIKRMHDHVNALTQRGLERFAWGLSAVAACLAVVGALQLMRPAPESTTAVAPAAWEGAAVALNGTSSDDTTAAPNSGDLAMAEWMVADLSEGSRTR